MKGLAFFDTNVLIYADDTATPAKQARAISLIVEHQRDNSLVVSLQVLQEYYAAATRKLKVDPATAQSKVEILARGRVVRFTERDVIAAIELHRLTQISFWDAMIVHAARAVNATVLYSEDLGMDPQWPGSPCGIPSPHSESFSGQIVSGRRNAAFRMVLGYWDMAASLVTTGAIGILSAGSARRDFRNFQQIYLYLGGIARREW